MYGLNIINFTYLSSFIKVVHLLSDFDYIGSRIVHVARAEYTTVDFREKIKYTGLGNSKKTKKI